VSSKETDHPVTQEELKKEFTTEDAYFYDLDQQRLAANKAKQNVRKMVCHNPQEIEGGCPLEEVEFHGVKIDKCALCGGIWLDAHEAEELIRHVEKEHEPPAGILESLRSAFRRH
jgi:hypothetical protein